MSVVLGHSGRRVTTLLEFKGNSLMVVGKHLSHILSTTASLQGIRYRRSGYPSKEKLHSLGDYGNGTVSPLCIWVGLVNVWQRLLTLDEASFFALRFIACPPVIWHRLALSNPV